MSLLATLRHPPPPLQAIFHPTAAAHTAEGDKRSRVGGEVGWKDSSSAKRKRFYCDTVRLWGTVVSCWDYLHYLTDLHGWGCRTRTTETDTVANWAAGACTCIQAWPGRANRRLCDCSGCWFMTLTHSRTFLLIIIFVNLIISWSVSMAMSINYIQIILINQKKKKRKMQRMSYVFFIHLHPHIHHFPSLYPSLTLSPLLSVFSLKTFVSSNSLSLKATLAVYSRYDNGCKLAGRE